MIYKRFMDYQNNILIIRTTVFQLFFLFINMQYHPDMVKYVYSQVVTRNVIKTQILHPGVNSNQCCLNNCDGITSVC